MGWQAAQPLPGGTSIGRQPVLCKRLLSLREPLHAVQAAAARSQHATRPLPARSAYFPGLTLPTVPRPEIPRREVVRAQQCPYFEWFNTNPQHAFFRKLDFTQSVK